MIEGGHGRRWSTRIGSAAACALLVAAGLGPRPGEAQVVPQGKAYGVVASIGPEAARLSLAVSFGVSLSDFRGPVARAESDAVDMGLIGTALVSKGCDGSDPKFRRDQLPTSLQVDSGDEGAAAGRSATYGGSPAGSPVTGAFSEQRVSATPDPRGQARTRVAVAGIPGVAEVAGGEATAETGVSGSERVATAAVAVPVLEFVGGALRLEDLRWEATHRSGSGESRDGPRRATRLDTGPGSVAPRKKGRPLRWPSRSQRERPNGSRGIL